MHKYRYFSGASRHDRVPRSMREAYQAGYTPLHVDDHYLRHAALDIAKAALIIVIGAPVTYWLAGVI